MISHAKAWKVMRGMGKFTVSDIITLAEEKNTKDLRWWLGLLCDAGYIKEDGKNGKEKFWRLLRGTGPLAPEVQTLRIVYDPNTGDCFCEDVCLPCPVKRGKIPRGKRELIKNLIAAGKTYREVARTLGISIGTISAIVTESRHVA